MICTIKLSVHQHLKSKLLNNKFQASIIAQECKRRHMNRENQHFDAFIYYYPRHVGEASDKSLPREFQHKQSTFKTAQRANDNK
jgi:hypothetical protein